VAWTLLPGNIIYGITVMIAGRLADRFSPQWLVIAGLCIYASAFSSYAGVNELVTATMMTTFLVFRYIAEGFVVGPNNLTALKALPEDRVMMAAGLMGLLRSIANILGASMAAVVWDARFGRHVQQFAEDAPIDTFGMAAMMREVQNTLLWTGEVATQITSKTLALLHRRLLAEASAAAWQDYLLFNALFALVAIIPALLVNSRLWRRSRPAASPAQPATAPTERQAQT
jgi:MFS family permease